MAETLSKSGTLSSIGVEKISLEFWGELDSGGSDKFVIATGVPDFRFCLLFA